MDQLLFIVSLITVSICVSNAGEMTFELPDNEKQCFFEEIDKGVESTLEFQVRTCLSLEFMFNISPTFKTDLNSDTQM